MESFKLLTFRNLLILFDIACSLIINNNNINNKMKTGELPSHMVPHVYVFPVILVVNKLESSQPRLIPITSQLKKKSFAPPAISAEMFTSTGTSHSFQSLQLCISIGFTRTINFQTWSDNLRGGCQGGGVVVRREGKRTKYCKIQNFFSNLYQQIYTHSWRHFYRRPFSDIIYE